MRDVTVSLTGRELSIPLRELSFRFVRSSGPGGQNVNKVSSKVELRWRPGRNDTLPGDVRQRFLERWSNRINSAGELLLTSQRYRDQGRNVADCVEKLRQMLSTIAIPPKRRVGTKPTSGSRRRRLQDKRAQAQKKHLRRKPGRDTD